MLLPAGLLRSFTLAPRLTWRYLVRGRRRFGFAVLWQFYQDAQLVALKPDLLHFEFGAPAPGQMYLKDLLCGQLENSFHGFDLVYVDLENDDFYNEVLGKADALHLLAKNLWQRALRRGCPTDKPHALIPPVLDLTFFDPKDQAQTQVVGTAKRPLRLLSIGRLDWRKGYEYALQAVRLLLDQGLQIEYRILGAGAYLEPLAYARRQLGLKESVFFLGAHPRKEVRKQMVWADIFLHAAVSEGFCNAVLEAQAMRLPVVCSDADGLAENVANEQNGFVVPRRDPQALAQKIQQLATDPALRQRFGQTGRERVQCLFKLDSQTLAFEGFYQTILSNSSND
ncbi:glycosyltransferase family 4 protein [Chloroflexota bacterium]